MIAGNPPIELRRFHIDCPELMFYQYLPVKMPGTDFRIPQNLQCFKRLIDEATSDYGVGDDEYVYITAKKMFIDVGCAANRPGWHLDGFGTSDVTYIWSDEIPTEFCIQSFDLSNDHIASLEEMEAQALPENIVTYFEGTLLRMDQHVVHRVGECKQAGYRTFVKISISKDKYNLIGNAHNYLFDYEWEMVERGESRNHPIANPRTTTMAALDKVFCKHNLMLKRLRGDLGEHFGDHRPIGMTVILESLGVVDTFKCLRALRGDDDILLKRLVVRLVESVVCHGNVATLKAIKEYMSGNGTVTQMLYAADKLMTSVQRDAFILEDAAYAAYHAAMYIAGRDVHGEYAVQCVIDSYSRHYYPNSLIDIVREFLEGEK